MIKKFDPLQYEDLKGYYNGYNSEIHDLNLTNLAIWHKKHELHTLEIQGYLWYVYNPNDPFNIKFSEPVGDYTQTDALKQATNAWIDYCTVHQYPISLRHVGETYKTFLSENGYDIVPLPVYDDFDYCYVTEELSNLAGNKFHKKKNHLNQFQKQYMNRFRIEPLTSDNVNGAFIAAKNWCVANGCGDTLDLCFEFSGIHHILSNWSLYQNRGLEGIVVYVDDNPVAFSFGEFLTKETFLVHIEKADQSIMGIYTAINHAMANQVKDRCLYLNREQDMGIEGIRKAKQSYHPHHLIPKYDVLIKTTPN